MKTTHPLQAQCRIETPLGPLLLAATAQGLAGAWFDGQAHHPGPLAAPIQPEHPHLAQAAHELAAYFAASGDGQAPAGFTLPLDPQGTAFQQQVWLALRGIATGRTCSYGAIARQVGKPSAVRAVGAAVGRNPLSVIVPCHRVLGGDGALTGYAGGLDRKRALLRHEGVL
jgi:methylated-DNA-[protein]-cysteine S-methyltransferase